ncbi:hypothetical protein BVG79_00930 [Ketogulonicigenium robustum]|uniref:DUF7742 domain-containing protein n=1 Tax=Ketogulonicigenium robustum TaxID=92947 RepID=A0A1W6NYG9_9RHOB|nr:hypothetical protein [Ketogulonicigenium robustum]ARO14282.1 hypothetical protein BVG79_00930 [Ketogulonicigenium robustum]
MTPHLGDIDLAARWLLARPQADWGRALGEMDFRLAAARAHVAATQRIHPDWGDGSVMALVLSQRLGHFVPAGAQGRLYLSALATAAFHFSQKLPS